MAVILTTYYIDPSNYGWSSHIHGNSAMFKNPDMTWTTKILVGENDGILIMVYYNPYGTG